MCPFQPISSYFTKRIATLCIFTVLCSSTLFAQVPDMFNQPGKSFLYRTKLEAFGFHFSGLMIFKCMEAKQYRAVFATETGVKLFEMVLKPGSPKLEYVMQEMKKPFFVGMIRKDLMMLVQCDRKGKMKDLHKRYGDGSLYKNGKRYYVVKKDRSHDELSSITLGDPDHARKVFFYEDYKNGIPTKMHLKHEALPVAISFEYIERPTSVQDAE